MRTLSITLPEDLLDLLNRESKARRVTKSFLVREGLEKTLRSQNSSSEVSCFDLSSDLAGKAKGLPKDLAVHPKYMDGFGK
jgi:predicted DNA-binding protein